VEEDVLDREADRDRLRQVDGAPAERDERGNRPAAASATAAGLHHLEELVGGVLDALVGTEQGDVQQEGELGQAWKAAAELAVGEVDAGGRLEVPHVGLRYRVALRVEGALDRLAALDLELRALESLGDGHQAGLIPP
jgi:hypothetical protein